MPASSPLMGMVFATMQARIGPLKTAPSGENAITQAVGGRKLPSLFVQVAGSDCQTTERRNGQSMELESQGLEGEGRRGQRILRLAIIFGIAAAEGLIRAVMLVLAINGMGVQGQAARVALPEDRIPREPDRRMSGPSLLNLEGAVNIEVTAISRNEEDPAQTAAANVLEAIRQKRRA